MKALPLHAASCLAAVTLLVSCSSSDVAHSGHGPALLSKERASQIAAMPGNWLRGTAGQGSFYPAMPSVAVQSSSVRYSRDKHGMPTYSSHGVRNRLVRATAYSCQENEPGAYGRLNATGTVLKYGPVRSAAADWSRYPVGTTFKIKGLPHTYVVDDYGSSLVGTNTVDIYHPTLSSMRKWGTQFVEINVVQWGDWDRTLQLLSRRLKYDHCRQMYYAARAKVGNRSYAASSQRGPSTL